VLLPHLNLQAWPTGQTQAPPPAFHLAAMLGMHRVMLDLVTSWPDDH
jgi:hypothetical protein